MATIRDMLLAQYLACSVQDLNFLDRLDEQDERWDEVVEEIEGGIRPGMSLLKKVFDEEWQLEKRRCRR